MSNKHPSANGRERIRRILERDLGPDKAPKDVSTITAPVDATAPSERQAQKHEKAYWGERRMGKGSLRFDTR